MTASIETTATALLEDVCDCPVRRWIDQEEKTAVQVIVHANTPKSMHTDETGKTLVWQIDLDACVLVYMPDTDSVASLDTVRSAVFEEMQNWTVSDFTTETIAVDAILPNDGNEGKDENFYYNVISLTMLIRQLPISTT